MDNIQTDQFLQKITDINTRVGNLERTTQPQIIDWYPLSPSSFSHIGTNNYLKVNDGTLLGIFQLGDRLTIKQGGVIKDFYVLQVDVLNGALWINGGDSYTFTSASIQSISVSKSPLPVNFDDGFSFAPLCFKYVPPWISYTPNLWNQITYSMTGDIVTMSIDSYANNWPSTYDMAFTLPFKAGSGINATTVSYGGIDTNGGPLMASEVRLSGISEGFPSDYVWEFYPASSYPFASGPNNVTATITFAL